MIRCQLRIPAAAWLLLVFPCLNHAQEQSKERASPRPVATDGKPAGQALTLSDLIGMGLERNPALQQAGLEIEAARGRAVQAGLYPNPTVSVVGEELGAREGPGGFITAPLISQEIVTGGKLKLSRAVALQRVDQASLALYSARYNFLTKARQGFFEVLAGQRREEILAQLVMLASQSYELTGQFLKAKQVAEMELLQFQIERDRLQSDLEATRQEQNAAWERLTANLGVPHLPYSRLEGSLEAALPEYDLAQARQVLVAEHPDVLVARLGVGQAELALLRQRKEWIPNVTVEAGYTRDNIGRQDEWAFRVGMPVPLFNRNQGQVQAARAELGQAAWAVELVENDLLNRLATAYGDYSAAKERSNRYRDSIRPAAKRAHELSILGFKAGQFDYLRVLQAQRALAEADLEYNRVLLQAWQAASVIAGMLQEEHRPASIQE